MDDSSLLRDRAVLPVGANEALAGGSDSLGHIDILTAGYPCQPFSTAARGRNNARDFWPDTIRIVRQLRPHWVVLENVPAYRLEHIERSCVELERLGYTCWPLDIAVEVRNHVRRRIWVVAYAHGESQSQRPVDAEVAGIREAAERWRHKPQPVGMDDGLPHRMDRLRSLGNSIESGIAESIFRAIASMNKGRM